jgi:protein SCO1/2
LQARSHIAAGQETKLNTAQTAIVWLALVAAALSGVALMTHTTARAVTPTPLPAEGNVISSVSPVRLVGDPNPRMPDFAFHNQHDQVVERRALLGQVWIADFIYTSCQSACPLLTSRLLTVQRRLSDPRLKFVSFSVDPERDTPAVLAHYADRWHASDPRWELLSTDAAGLKTLSASMKLDVTASASEILHTDRFFLLDAQGAIAGSFEASDDAALERLIENAARLLGSVPARTVSGGTGAELFSSLGCVGCHSDAQLAPPLAGLFGAHVMLERGGTVTADAAYVRESISAPAAKLVAGYPSSMPTYGPLLSSAQLDALVGYVRSLRGTRVAELATSDTDPVCGMPVRVTKDAPAAEYRGRSYHFCSLTCAQHFQANPHKYLPAN